MSLLENLIQEREQRLIALHRQLTGESVSISNNENDTASTHKPDVQSKTQPEVSRNVNPQIRQTPQEIPIENDVTSDLKAKVVNDLAELKRRTDISIRNILRRRIIRETSED
ncbi:hypothetical protein C6P45_005347 [Maudiozyma exigua]|uniref:Uncharacterized protein n=1 Tax=Maudiozyma exigua TaxID=34358 RepID=A0A9P6WBB6_MAUEX|nr:hypothetical protein C6P45_005347 [Kazachstania exigua]